MSARVHPERELSRRARSAQQAIAALDAQIAPRIAKRDALVADLLAFHRETEQRFGLTIPADPVLLDVLQSIDVQNPGEVWRWTGARNNKNLPIYKLPRCPEYPNGAERSVVRFLALAFGLITEDEPVALYPRRGATDDVNPWHRTIRQHPRLPQGAGDFAVKEVA